MISLNTLFQSLLVAGILLFVAISQALGQCNINPTSWSLLDECGDINANGGTAQGSPTVFCEGVTVTVANNSTPVADIQTTYINWGDGQCQTFPGCPPTLIHIYDFPNDTCINNSLGTIQFSVALGIEKKCTGNKRSFNFANFPIKVRFKPIAQFYASPASGCVNSEIDFTNQSCVNSQNPTYKWDMGNGQTFTTEDVSNFKYTTAGTYTVKLTVTNECGSNTFSQVVTVTPPATAAFTMSATQLCTQQDLAITNQSTYANGYQWTITGPSGGFQFVAPTSSNSKDPKIKFLKAGTYTIKLKVNGCGNPETMQTITILEGAFAAIAPILDQCGTAASVSVTPTATIFGAPTSVNWTFSGGSPSTFSGNAPGPITYPNSGTFILTTSATNFCGTFMDSDTFNIAPEATAVFELSKTELCGPDEILDLTNTSANAFGNFSWTVAPATGFQFTGGTTAGSQNPKLKFTKEGTYTIMLKVNACGYPTDQKTVIVRLKPTVSLAATPDGCDASLLIAPASLAMFGGGAASQVQWNFLNGTPATATGAMPPDVLFSSVGTFAVSVSVMNQCGTETKTDTFSIISAASVAIDSVAPICNSVAPFQLTAMPSGGVWSGANVNASGLFNPANAALSSPSMVTYTVGSGNCQVKDEVKITVQGTAVNAGPDKSLCGNASAFSLAGSPAGGVWSGAGVSAVGFFNPQTAMNGANILTYTFTDAASGCVNSDKATVTLLGAPSAGLDSIGRVCVGESFNLGPFSGGSGVSSCQWNFGDGGTSSQCDPSHTWSASGLFTLTLFVQNTAGCKDTATAQIEAVPPPMANFSTDLTEGCADLAVKIQNASGTNSYADFFWDYGDGRKDTLAQPGTIVFKQGETDTTYLIILKAVNECGEATDSQPITVFPRPIVRFGPDKKEGCTPLEVNFNNVTVGDPDVFEWFINGVSQGSPFQLPMQKFLTTDHDSIYQIMLVAQNECGSDTLVQEVVVHPNPVKAFFTPSALTGCAPFLIDLIDFSTQGLFVSWDLGDGNLATGDTVQHVFEKAGQFLIREFVNNGCGFDTTEATVTVLEAPEVSFEHEPFVCLGDSIFFKNTSPALAGSAWFFGDGGQSNETSPAHVFDSVGTFSAKLTGLAQTTACPASDSSTVEVKALPVADIALVDSFGCQPFVFEPENQTLGTHFWVWDFGDGSFSTEKSPSHLFAEAGQYAINLRLTDLFGCQNDWNYAPINVFKKPTADFEYAQTELCQTPATLVFQNKSMDSDAWAWDFGPVLGGSSQQNPTLSILAIGQYSVELQAWNQFGCRDTTEKSLKIYAKPQLDFEVSSVAGCAPLAIQFENRSTSVNQFSWHFGDSGQSNEADPSHIFENLGTYSVALFASQDSVCFDSLKINGLINVNPSPTAAFEYEELTDTTVVPNGILRFFDRSTGAKTWAWDFDDDSFSDEKDPVHRFLETTAFNVWLTVENEFGCRDSTADVVFPDDFGGLFIPNAFAPESGDAAAQHFQPVGAGLIEFDISIFAPNGQRVWHSGSLEKGQPDAFWDGSFDEKALPQGVYVWKARARFSSGRIWKGMKYGGAAGVKEGKILLIR